MHGISGRIVLVLGAACGFSSPGCDSAQSGTVAESGSREVQDIDVDLGDPTQIDPRFEARLLAIATEYTNFSLVVGGIRWAPTACYVPPAPMSSAAVGTPHGEKLYYLFARDAGAYTEATQHAQPVSQVIVKQSWSPEEIDGVAQNAQRTTKYMERDGKKYRPGHPADLFIMFKEEPAAAGTDNGWIYGTVTPDGQRVTSAGRVAACMECHQSAKPDRLFGVKRASAAAED